jgi:hypothetical protein
MRRTGFGGTSPADGPAGSLSSFTERLLDASGKQIGSDSAVCVRLFDEGSLCTGTYLLRGGQVMVQLLQPGQQGTSGRPSPAVPAATRAPAGR